MSEDDDFWREQLAKAKVELLEVEETLSGYADSVQSSSIDTGQTRVSKSKFELASLVRRQSYLEEKISRLQLRLNGGGSVVVARY